jgi:hypothetical protein
MLHSRCADWEEEEEEEEEEEIKRMTVGSKIWYIEGEAAP